MKPRTDDTIAGYIAGGFFWESDGSDYYYRSGSDNGLPLAFIRVMYGKTEPVYY